MILNEIKNGDFKAGEKLLNERTRAIILG